MAFRSLRPLSRNSQIRRSGTDRIESDLDSVLRKTLAIWVDDDPFGPGGIAATTSPMSPTPQVLLLRKGSKVASALVQALSTALGAGGTKGTRRCPQYAPPLPPAHVWTPRLAEQQDAAVTLPNTQVNSANAQTVKLHADARFAARSSGSSRHSGGIDLGSASVPIHSDVGRGVCRS